MIPEIHAALLFLTLAFIIVMSVLTTGLILSMLYEFIRDTVADYRAEKKRKEWVRSHYRKHEQRRKRVEAIKKQAAKARAKEKKRALKNPTSSSCDYPTLLTDGHAGDLSYAQTHGDLAVL